MNDSGIIHLKDEKFNIAQSREMHLLIRVAPQRISYAIINERDSRMLAFFDSPIKNTVEITIDELLSTNRYLLSRFARVKVSVQTSDFTFIPTQYYTQDSLEDYEKFIQSHGETKTFISGINTDSIKCIIALELNTIAPFIGAFTEVRFFSQAEPLIEAALKIHDLHTRKLVLQFNHDTFEACVADDEKLLFYNIYSIENADDFNYYLLLVIQTLALQPDSTSVILAGNIVLDDENFKRIEKYFHNIRLADCGEITNLSSAFDEVPKHLHFALISLMRCE